MVHFNYIKFAKIPNSRLHIPQLLSYWDNWATSQRTFLSTESFGLYGNYNETLFLHFYYDRVIN